jgi:hypothetical protein
MIHSRSRIQILLLCTLVCVVGAACNRTESGADAGKATTVSTEMQARLAMADEVDGTKDSIVERCAGCRLGMQGSAEHPLQVGDFEMHFCSADCRTRFAEDVEKSVLAMTTPEH